MDEWFLDWFDADYATLYAHRDEEEAGQAVRTALKAAPVLAQGPVLDLGCGSGRHLTELRKVNPLAFGLDLSKHLLELSPRILRGWLLRGDMRHLPIRPGNLSGICLWFTPFGYFHDRENRRLLCSLRGLLRPGGVLLLDFLNAHHLRETLVEEDIAEQGGLRVQSHRAIEGDRLVKRMRIERIDTGVVREVMESIRIYESIELRAMAQSCGLTLVQELGDYDGSSFRDTVSPRWIGLFSL